MPISAEINVRTYGTFQRASISALNFLIFFLRLRIRVLAVSGDMVGNMISLEGSMFNHSCNPNAAFSMTKDGSVRFCACLYMYICVHACMHACIQTCREFLLVKSNVCA
jgi:hypothetical protein